MDDTTTQWEFLETLAPFLGTWSGEGFVRFPTIGRYDYREELRFEPDRERPLIHYEQRATQCLEASGRWEASHWESGFLRPLEPATVEMINTQDSGRLEIIRLAVLPLRGGGLQLHGDSTLHANDPRIVRTRREFELTGDRLSYRVFMATTRVPEGSWHLEARLSRRH